MAHVQYQTSVPWDLTLTDLGYTSDGYVESAVKITTGAPTATAGKFIPAAQILNKVSGITYTNTGSTASPTWTALGGGGGGIAIGDAITDADAASILYVDASGNLTQDAGYTRTSTGVTNISSTFGTDIVSYEMNSDIFSLGTAGIGTKIQNASGDYGLSSLINAGGTIRDYKTLIYSTGERSTSSLYKNRFSTTVTVGVDTGEIDVQKNQFSLKNDSSGIANGIENVLGSVTMGNLGGGNGTKILINDTNQVVTITNVPTYADDAAAITGGLTTGMLYKTTTTGVTALNIVP